MLFCSPGHPPSPISPPFPADPSRGCISQGSSTLWWGPSLIPASPSATTSIYATKNKTERGQQQGGKSAPFSAKSHLKGMKQQAQLLMASMEAKDTQHSPGAWVANGSASAIPFSPEASTIPPNTRSPQVCFSPCVHWKSCTVEKHGRNQVQTLQWDESHSIVQPNTPPTQKSPLTASPRLAEQVGMLQDLGEKLVLL